MRNDIQFVLPSDIHGASAVWLAQKTIQNGVADAEGCTSVARELASSREQERRFAHALQNGLVLGSIKGVGAFDGGVTSGVPAFMQPIGDALTGLVDGQPGIFDAMRDAVDTLRRGCSVCYDFSFLRPQGAPVRGSDIHAAGPVAYIRLFDQMCTTVVANAGAARQKGVLRIDHPDIESFIELVDLAAQHGKAASTDYAVRGGLARFDLSIAVTDKFMEAVEANAEFELVHTVAAREHQGGAPYVYRTVNARDLWNKVLHRMFEGASQLSVIFVDQVNRDNNLAYVEQLFTTDPCGAYGVPDYGGGCSGHIDLSKFVVNAYTSHAQFDFAGLQRAVSVGVEMLDLVVDRVQCPLPRQTSDALAKRRIGLGVTAMVHALAMLGIPYQSAQAESFATDVSRAVAESAYLASVELAKQHGPFPFFESAEYLREGSFASRLAPHIRSAIVEHGIRNSHLLCCDPSSAISLSSNRVEMNGAKPTSDSQLSNDAALSFFQALGNDSTAEVFVSTDAMTMGDHMRLLEAVAPYVDAPMGKTIDVPSECLFDEFAGIFTRAWRSGFKGLSARRHFGSVGLAGAWTH